MLVCALYSWLELTGRSHSYHGGWLAPDIYFLGFAGCVIIDGWLRIAGASGIYKSHDFSKGEFRSQSADEFTSGNDRMNRSL